MKLLFNIFIIIGFLTLNLNAQVKISTKNGAEIIGFITDSTYEEVNLTDIMGNETAILKSDIIKIKNILSEIKFTNGIILTGTFTQVRLNDFDFIDTANLNSTFSKNAVEYFWTEEWIVRSYINLPVRNDNQISDESLWLAKHSQDEQMSFSQIGVSTEMNFNHFNIPELEFDNPDIESINFFYGFTSNYICGQVCAGLPYRIQAGLGLSILSDKDWEVSGLFVYGFREYSNYNYVYKSLVVKINLYFLFIQGGFNLGVNNIYYDNEYIMKTTIPDFILQIGCAYRI